MFSGIDLGKRPLYAKYYGTRTKLLVKINCDFCLKTCSVNVPRSEVKFLGRKTANKRVDLLIRQDKSSLSAL